MNPTAALLEPEIRELVEQGRYGELRHILHDLDNADVADILSELDAEKAALAFRFLPRDDAAETFSYLGPEKQEELIEKLGNESAASIVDAMSPDDAARLMDELPPEVAQRIVQTLSPQTRKVTQAILGYPPKSVGRLMTPDYVAVKPEWTVAQAMEHIRRVGRDAETINVIYVVDDAGKLIDDLRIRQIFLADPSQTIESLMNHAFSALTAEMPQSAAVEMLRRYDRVALPVVDSRGHLVGIVTHDDVADVEQEEATEDFQKMGGVGALEEPFMSASVLDLFRKRVPWLALLFLSELLTSNAIAFFEDEIKRAAILAAFIPAIISSGGNSGSQSSTLVIRALGLREIELGDWFRVLRRELAVGAMLGAVIGGIGLLRINLFGWFGWFSDADVMRHYEILGWTISLTLLCVVLWGSIMGSMLPFILKRFRLDPAASSTPFVATLVDVTGIVIYFTCAILVLRSTLLRPMDPEEAALPATVEAHVISGAPDGDRDPYATLVVQTEAQRAGDERSRVRVPLEALPGGEVPAPGTRVRIHFRVGEGERVERID